MSTARAFLGVSDERVRRNMVDVLVIAGMIGFLATNVDELFVRLRFLSDPHSRPLHVVTGQYLARYPRDVGLR